MKKNLLLAAVAVVFSFTMPAQCGALFSDGFESGTYAPTWTVGSAPITWVVNTTNPASGLYSLEGTGGNSTHLTGLSASIPSCTPTNMSWDIYPTGSGAANYMVAGDNSVTATNCIAFCYWQGGTNIRFVSGVTAVYNCLPNQWYHVEMRNINWSAHTFDIYINNTLVYATFPFRNSGQNSLTRIHLYNFNSATGVWDNILVGNAPVLATSFTAANVSCNGGANGSATASATGGNSSYTYNWLPSGGTAATATGLTAGTFSCIVTDGVGCMDTTTVTVTEPTAIVSTLSQTNVSCNGSNNGNATVTTGGGTPGYSYSWSPSGGTGATDSVLIAGGYTCTITDANGCTATETFSITEPTALVIAAANNGSVCPGDTAMLVGTATGGTMNYTYDWMPGNLSGSTPTSNPTIATTYTLLVTDANGCTDSSTTTVNVYTPPVVSLGADFSSCANAMIDAQNAGSNFLWSEGSTTQMISVNMSGPYDVTVTDTNGCAGRDTINVTINANPTVVGSAAMNFVCVGEPTIQLFESPAGGTWTGNGVFGSTFEPDTAGAGLHDLIYNYTDSLGCSGVDTIQINVDLCLGINPVAESGVIVYPNPNSGTFEIVFSNNAQDVRVEITDATGRMVYTSTSASVVSGEHKQINVSEQANGIYLLHVMAGDSSSTSRITIQH